MPILEPSTVVAPAFAAAADYVRLRDLLTTAGYNDKNLRETLGLERLTAISARDRTHLLSRGSGDTALHTLIRLFFIEAPCAVEAVERAITPANLQSWLVAGLVQSDGATVFGKVKLLPFRDMILACDPLSVLESGLASHYVMGIGQSTQTIANLLITRPSRRSFDLGTGCGVLAFLMAGNSDRVIAVDRNPRAVGMAAFNAELNGLDNIECRESDFFSALGDEPLELIVTNPPFVISPENRYLYRDGGMAADKIIGRIVAEAPGFLAEGGFCQILCNWAEAEKDDWRERLAIWFKDSGCDVFVLRCETSDAATYAATWIRHTERADTAHYDQRFDEWRRYYEEEGIARISAGLVVMRKKAAEPCWFQADEAPPSMVGPCGDAILHRFHSQDFIEKRNEDGKLLAASVTISPHVRLERTAFPAKGQWEDEALSIRLCQGLAYAGNIDPFMAKALVRCDGSEPLGRILTAVAAERGIDAGQVGPQFCALVRYLIVHGFLLPDQGVG